MEVRIGSRRKELIIEQLMEFHGFTREEAEQEIVNLLEQQEKSNAVS